MAYLISLHRNSDINYVSHFLAGFGKFDIFKVYMKNIDVNLISRNKVFMISVWKVLLPSNMFLIMIRIFIRKGNL